MATDSVLARFGFVDDSGSAHMARSSMYEDLVQLLDYVDDVAAPVERYRQAILDDNCLAKRSGRSRSLTLRHLSDLYTLDPSVPLFRTLRYFWQRDAAGRPLLAILCAYARDALLRTSWELVFGIPYGRVITRETTEAFLLQVDPDRFSAATLRSTAQNLNTSWTRSGHLTGKVEKARTRAHATTGAAAYAYYLAYVSGARGLGTFETDYARLLDCPQDKAIDLAHDASARGWLRFRRIGDVAEIAFPELLTTTEQEWLRE